ncbi:MAG TPA: response regulator, partial [Candidatus Polarisedimenticolia bacterium]|nr:response regulator [Candidatus Polarisedimenticolia bacterium]
MNDFKVLIADDSAIHRRLVEQTLSQDACTVLVAQSGREAIEVYEREHPALVITDWIMPDLTGL